MRAVLQRVSEADVTVNQEIIGSIEYGLVVLLGVAAGDEPRDSEYLVDKICNLRIFADAAGKMNRSISDINGGVLAISQFTLLADCRKGRRPSFINAAPPQQAEAFYHDFVERLKQRIDRVATGVFAADMKVRLINDGPVTILLDSRDRK